MGLVEKTFQIIQRHGLMPSGSLVIVGVSGGPDSLALLHILHQLRERSGFRLHVATLDHQLRGKAGEADARFVEQTATEWNIPVSVGRADVQQVAGERGIGIELAARLARYAFLAQVAEQSGGTQVATAHHLDDQAETILMHILRGAGVDGLEGMTAQGAMPGYPHLTLVRPFLKVTRAEIAAYCEEHGLEARDDATNRDTSIPRNYIRREVLPQLQKLNPSLPRVLAQLGEIASVERDYIERQLQKAVERHTTVNEGSVVIEREVFRDLHPALQRRFIYWTVQQFVPNTGDMGYIHIVNAIEVGLRSKLGAVALLTGGMRLRVDYDSLVVERIDAPVSISDIPLTDTEVQVSVPGLTAIPNSKWLLRVSTEADMEYQARLAIAEGHHLILRPRRAGDRFAPLGMGGHRQKVGRWMIKRKIPKLIRDRIPMLVVDGEIAAIVVGTDWTIGEAFAVNEEAHRVLYFAVEQMEEATRP